MSKKKSSKEWEFCRNGSEKKMNSPVGFKERLLDSK